MTVWLLVCQDMNQQAVDIKMYMRHHLFRFCVYTVCVEPFEVFQEHKLVIMNTIKGDCLRRTSD